MDFFVLCSGFILGVVWWDIDDVIGVVWWEGDIFEYVGVLVVILLFGNCMGGEVDLVWCMGEVE